MSTAIGLADLLFGRTRGAILALLYGHADQTFYTRQIAREVDASIGAVQRELENLSKVGLIVRNSLGSQVFYQANRSAPIFKDRSEEHTSELQSRGHLVCRLLLE